VSGTVRRIIGPTILLFGGSYFDFESPETSDFTLEDIAHGLAMTCRFAGQCSRFYSVAQHSVHVSEFVPPEDAFAGLMHDTAEAFVGDVSKPLKEMLPQYKEIEKRVEAAIFARVGLSLPLAPSIKETDIRMLVTEQRQLMRNRDDWDYTRGMTPLAFEIPTWSADEAKARFIDRFRSLVGRAMFA